MKVTFNKVKSGSRDTSSYRADGIAGTIYLGGAAFNGNHPESFTIEDVPENAKAEPAKAKMTKEERKAALAARTPADIAAAAQKTAEKAVARAKKLAEKAAAPAVA